MSWFTLAPLALLLPLTGALAQQPPASVKPVVATRADTSPAAAAASKAPPATAAGANSFTPTWETQKGARTYMLGIPAPRGQIVDRNGLPFAQTRVSYNLAIAFPTPLNFSEREAQAFVQKQVGLARSIIGRLVNVSPEQASKHYKNRGVVPLVIAQDLKPAEIETFNTQKPEHLTLQPVYQRIYANGSLAAHIVGYAGRSGRIPDGVLENNELLWPNADGREGLEQAFNDQLQGKVGQYNISFDPTGKKASEQITIPPQPGYNVVTSLDLNLQRMCEESLARSCKRGAIVIVDPNNGDILAMASWPTFNPNLFVPAISQETYDTLRNDAENPLIPRAYRSSYPPGSTFKVFVGLAAMQSAKIGPGDEFTCPTAIEIGNLTFRNWKKQHMGDLNFADALTQSCNTWFYQVGMKIGSRPIIDTATRLGLGMRTGIPLEAETAGRVPTDEYMMKVYNRRLLNGDVANLSIGQGDLLISPLQMAQAMAAVGNGGTLYQMRLVQQVQSIDNQIVTAYGVRARMHIDMESGVIKALRHGMAQVVSSPMGTAGKAAVPGVKVAGKTGTAQWGPKNNERTAAWFAGFVPVDKPRYAFAALYEGAANNDDVHGGTNAAPMIGRVLREIYKTDKPEKNGKKKKKKRDDDDDDAEEDDVPVRRAEPVNRDEVP